MIGSTELTRRRGNLYQKRSDLCNIFYTDFKVRQLFVILFEKWSRPRFSADASDFLRRYPWPGRAISDTFDDTTHRKGNFAKKFMSAMKVICGRTGQEEDLYDDEIEEQSMFFDQDGLESGRPFYWTRQLQQSFREELEKYIIMFSPSGVFR